MSSTIEHACRRLRAGRQHRRTRTATGRAAGGLLERRLMAEELPAAMLKYFVPFKDFYGGWLVYELGGKLWRQYAVPAEMRAAGVGFTSPI